MIYNIIMSARHSGLKSFGYAGNGIKEAFQNEPNFRFHTIVGIFALILGFIFKLSVEKFALLILTIFLVIILELLNTAIEKVVDKISPNYSHLAKVAKDVSAAAVLLSAFAAVLVGLLLFGPNIVQFASSLIH